MIRKSPTLAKSARMGHPTAKAKFKGKAQLQRQSPTLTAKVNFEGKGQLQRQKAQLKAKCIRRIAERRVFVDRRLR
jgi:hypothetical protein